jgi:pyrimidine operon attenuation protein/uracil phosphoribosyltransferase
VKLAALVDRGGRQLPIAAQFVGATLALNPGQSIALKRDARGRLILELRAEAK